jgi:hypothetical protein
MIDLSHAVLHVLHARDPLRTMCCSVVHQMRRGTIGSPYQWRHPHRGTREPSRARPPRLTRAHVRPVETFLDHLARQQATSSYATSWTLRAYRSLRSRIGYAGVSRSSYRPPSGLRSSARGKRVRRYTVEAAAGGRGRRVDQDLPKRLKEAGAPAWRRLEACCRVACHEMK